MDFQRARTEENINKRKNEILDACEKLYVDKDFEGVTFSAISSLTTFKRTTIYSYYKTREEILIDLLSREFDSWAKALKQKENKILTKDEYCKFITKSFCKNKIMLRLLAQIKVIENNCSLEKVTDYKKSFKSAFDTLNILTKNTFKNVNENNLYLFDTHFIIFAIGLYPYSTPTEKQLQADKLANFNVDFLNCEAALLSYLKNATKIFEKEN